MIKIYNQSLVPQFVIPRLKSVIWTRRFYDAGKFEIHLPKHTQGVEYLKQGYFIAFGGYCGIISYRHEKADEIEVQGYDLSGILAYRICNGSKSGNAETVIKSYVSENIIAPTDTSRAISVFQNATSQNRGDNISWSADHSNLLDKVKKIGSTYELGFDVIFDRVNKKLVFDVLKGSDKTKTVVFCREYKNISDYNYEDDRMQEVNTVIMHCDNLSDVVYPAKGTYTGLNLKETYSDYGDKDAVDDIKTKADSVLADKKYSETIEATTNERLNYKTDWDLGDYVTVRISAFGEVLSLQKQVTEVEEVYENNNVKITPTFGTRTNDIIKKLVKG